MLMSMKGITDTHAHICDPVFDPDRSLVLEKARRVGVSCVIAVAENLADAEKTLALAAEYPMIRPAAGQPEGESRAIQPVEDEPPRKTARRGVRQSLWGWFGRAKD